MAGKELNNIPPEHVMSAARRKRPKEALTELLKQREVKQPQPGLAFKIVKLA